MLTRIPAELRRHRTKSADRAVQRAGQHGDILVPVHAEADRRTEHGGSSVEGPEAPAVACRLGMDATIGLSLEHEVACSRERAAVVRTRRLNPPGRARADRVPCGE